MFGKPKTPKHLRLFGDKAKQIESAQHVIEFPGGAIELSRTTDGSYWAHILINHSYATDDCEGFRSSLGSIIDSRLDNGQTIEKLPNQATISQVAIRIKPSLEIRVKR